MPFLLLRHRRRPFFAISATSPPCPRTRTFLTLPPNTQHFTATRTLPYPPKPLYNIITDIASYPLFLPYLTSARVLSYSAPDATHGKRWPRTAELGMDWGGVLEMGFRSRVFCVPERSVEAVAGPRGRVVEVGKGGADLAHYEGLTKEEKEEEEEEEGYYDTGGVFSSLMTRWTLRQLPSTSGREGIFSQEDKPRMGTEVDLAIDVEFASPAYAALSQAAAPKMADIMIEAFEKRARSLLIGWE